MKLDLEKDCVVAGALETGLEVEVFALYINGELIPKSDYVVNDGVITLSDGRATCLNDLRQPICD